MAGRREETALVLFVMLIMAFGQGCVKDQKPAVQANTPTQMKTIDDVIKTYADSLMAIPGVVGVYHGLNEKGATCLKVMVKKKTPEIEKRIPRELDGFLVEIDETGEIRPMK